jgi:hypothetical protein
MSLDPIASAVDAAILGSPWSETVLYQRPQSSQLNALAAFAVAVVIDAGGEYASPSSSIFADVFLQTSAIPGGPQKGDQLVISDSALPPGTYLVQEIFWDRKAGSAHLKVRWTGQ